MIEEYIVDAEYIEKLDEWLGEHGITEFQRMQIRARLYLTPHEVLSVPASKVPEGVLLKLCECGNDTFRFVETADWMVELEQWEGDELLKICTRCGKKVACISDMKNGKSISRKTLVEIRRGEK